jgi:tetratricopeptide (TPR) repeat protein
MKTAGLRFLVVLAAAAVCWRAPLSARDFADIGKLLEAGRLDDATTAAGAVPEPGLRHYWESKLYFYRGDYPAALQAADAALAADPKESTRQLRRYYEVLAAVHRDAVETESAHFRIRTQGTDRLLARYALDCLEKTYERIGTMVGDHPAEKVLVEVYPGKDEFSLGSTLTPEVIEKSGTIGICKFNRLMILSPRALPLGYPWLDTLAHEYTHFLVNRASGGICPLWLHEGIARYHDTLWRSETSEYLTADAQNRLGAAREKKSFVSFKRMHPSIVYLDTPDDMSLAFAEVAAAVDYLRREFGGEDTLRRLLREMPSRGPEGAFRAALGVSPAAFEKRFYTFVGGMDLVPSRGIVGDRVRYTMPAEDECVGADQRGLLRLGDRMRQAGRPDAALVHYGRALAAEPDNPVILLKVARSYRETGDTVNAEKMLRTAIGKNPGYVTPYQALGELYSAGGDYVRAAAVLEHANAINPFHPDTHRYLSRCRLAAGDRDGAVYELRAVLMLDPGDAESRVLLERLSPLP